MVEASAAMKVGTGLIGLGLVIGLLTSVADTAIFGISGGSLVFFGLLILVIATMRGEGSQQQQQQLVIVQGDGGDEEAQEAVRCPSCQGLNPMRASFCGGCGTGLGKRS